MKRAQLWLSSVALLALTATANAGFTVTYTGSGGSIPDNGGYANPLILTITVPDSYQIIAIQSVTINGFTHTWVGDLIVRFEKQGGPMIALFQRVQGNGGTTFGDNDNLAGNYTFIPGAGYPTIHSQATVGTNVNLPIGNYQPAGLAGGLTATSPGPNTLLYDYSSFVGLNTQGDWRLLISDHASGDLGSVQNWSITFLVPEPASLIALGAGLAGLIGLRRRKK